MSNEDSSILSSADDNGSEHTAHEFRKVRVPRQYITDLRADKDHAK